MRVVAGGGAGDEDVDKVGLVSCVELREGDAEVGLVGRFGFEGVCGGGFDLDSGVGAAGGFVDVEVVAGVDEGDGDVVAAVDDFGDGGVGGGLAEECGEHVGVGYWHGGLVIGKGLRN